MVKSTRTRGRQSARTGSFEIFAYPQRSVPVRVLGLAWRWRVELITVSVGTVVVLWLHRFLPMWGVGLLELAVIAVVVIVPGSRRWVVAQVWCVISRHRARSCFVQSRVMTHEGLLPLFVWSRATPVGERLRLWLRPGLSVGDLESVTDRLAVACWAREARVEVHPKRVSTVWVHIIRRDPLAGSGQITSPLLEGVPVGDVEDGELSPLPDRAAVHAARLQPGDAPSSAAVTEGRTARRVGARQSPGAAAVEPVSVPVVGWSGEDVSDYV